MWREFIQELVHVVQYPIKIEFADGANEEQMNVLKMELGIALPEDLESLLYESNGISDEYGLGIIWKIEEIRRYNREMRMNNVYKECYMSFADMLFFADAGNGDRFAFPVIQGKVNGRAVFAWDHEDDSRQNIAFSLKSYLERLLSGKISI